MKKLILFFLFILSLFSFAQSSYKSESEPLIGGLYMQSKCDGEIIVEADENRRRHKIPLEETQANCADDRNDRKDREDR